MAHPACAGSFGDLHAPSKAEIEMMSSSQTGGRWAMKSRKLWYVIALSMLSLMAARIAVAQEQPPPPGEATQEQGFPPSESAQEQGPPPGAARVSMINGEVSTMRGDSGEWVAAVVNAPVVGGDTVATAARARA